MAIPLDDATASHLEGSIQRFFREELDRETGVLESLLREFALSVYHQAMAGARTHLEEKLPEMGGARCGPESDSWKRR